MLGDQDDVLVLQVQGMPFGLGDETLRVAGDDVGQPIAGIGVVVGELLTQVVSGKADGAASVFLLHKSQQVGGIADLGFDLLLAVPEVVVGDHGDNHPAFVAGAHLERASAVVELFRLLPAHAVAALPRRCIVVVGKSELPFGQFRQVRRQDHRARVACPPPGFQGGVVVRQVGVTTVTKDGLHEVEVCHQRSRSKETHLQAALT